MELGLRIVWHVWLWLQVMGFSYFLILSWEYVYLIIDSFMFLKYLLLQKSEKSIVNTARQPEHQSTEFKWEVSFISWQFRYQDKARVMNKIKHRSWICSPEMSIQSRNVCERTSFSSLPPKENYWKKLFKGHVQLPQMFPSLKHLRLKKIR